MSQKYFFLNFGFWLLAFSLLLCLPIAALDPIIINSSTFSPPPSQGDPNNDVNYYSNDILHYNVTCKAPVTIQETFQPHCITRKGVGDLDANGGCLVYRPYAVTTIHGKVSFGLNNYLNLWYRDVYNHWGSRPKLLDDDGFPKAMTSFNMNSFSGSTNASTRSTPSQLLNCLKGQRLIQAIRSLENKDNPKYQSVVNEAVSWSDGTSYVAAQTKPGLKPVRLVDIAIAMADLPFLDPNTCLPDPEGKTVYYDPNVSCFTNPPPIAFPGVNGYQKTYIKPFDACRLLQRAVQVADIGSNDRVIRIVDDDPDTPVEHDSSIPLGNLSTNKDIPQLLLTHNQPIPPVDICATIQQVESRDKPNSATFELIGHEYPFGIVYDTPQTFKKTFIRTYKLDVRIPATFATYKVALNNLLPKETQLKYGTVEFNSSAEDKKKTLDPGNNIVEKVFRKLVWPNNSL